MKKKNILFLSRWYPYPPNNGSKLRIYNLLRGLADGNDITLLSFSDNPVSDRLENPLDHICCEQHIIPYMDYRPQSINAIVGLFNPMPRSLYNTYSPEMENKIREVLLKNQYDLAITSEIGTAIYRPCFSNIPAILEDLEIGVPYANYISAKKINNRIRKGLTWYKLENFLSSLLPSFQLCTVVSNLEKELLSDIDKGHANVQVIPNCIDINEYKDINYTQKKYTLIFTGSFKYRVNYQAMQWFIERVFPIIKMEIPEIALFITGDRAGLSLPNMDSIFQTGMVPDIRPLVAGATISIAPILTGGGTRIKILEAMALKTPVVSTTKGAEGINVTDGVDINIADEPADFAYAILKLINDPETRTRIANNAYQLIRDQYDWQVVMPTFLDLVDRVSSSTQH